MPITEAKSSDNVLLGLGTLGLCTLPANSPQTFSDVGYLKGMKINYTRELKDFTSAGLLVKRLVFRDRYSWEGQWAEVNVTKLNKVFQGTLLDDEHVQFGGSKTITRFAARFEHTKDNGDVLTFDMYRCAPGGSFDFNFAEEDFIIYNVVLDAELDTAKPSGRQYGQIFVA